MIITKRNNLLLFFATTILYASLISCNDKKETFSSKDMIGEYRIGQYASFDSTKQDRAQKAADWKIVLKENNNFQITGTGINVVGYWTPKQGDNKKYYILLQGGGYKTEAQFDATHIFFDKPTGMLDSVFAQVMFARVDKTSK